MTKTASVELTGEEGGEGEDHSPSQRRCAIKRSVHEKAKLVRLVAGPGGMICPDVAEKLPGRGVWVTAERALIDSGILDGSLAKALGQSLKKRVKAEDIPADLGGMIEKLLERRVLDRIGLLNRSGLVVTGFDKIGAALKKEPSRRVAALLMASDVAEDSEKKMVRVAGHAALKAKPFDRDTLSSALGRENIVHVMVFDGGGVDQMAVALDRLCSMRKSGTSPACDAVKSD